MDIFLSYASEQRASAEEIALALREEGHTVFFDRTELPEGFQTSEFLLEHGYIDRIVRRGDLKSEIARAIDYCGK